MSDSPHESIKDIVGSIWHNNRPLAIAIFVILGVVVFIIYKKSQTPSSLPLANAAATPTGPVGQGGTYTNIFETITKTINPPPNPVGPPIPPPPPRPGIVQTVYPAPKGTLHPGAGNGDTNWFPKIIPSSMTLQQAASQLANWSSSSQLYNYRNNAAIFSQMGVPNSPTAKVVPGWTISV